MRFAIGHALLRAGGEGLTAARLAELTEKDQSNLKKVAEELCALGVLRKTPPPAANGQPGPRPRDAFAFAEGESERFEEEAGARGALGAFDVGSCLVHVDARQHPDTLREVLSLTEVVRGADKIAYTRGDREEYVFSFTGPNADSAAGDLMDLFADAQLRSWTTRVAEVSSPRELIETMRRRRRRIEASRRKRGEMSSAPESEP